MPHTAQSALEPFARLKLHRVANDPGCQFLTLEDVTPKIDDKGKSSESTATVVQHLATSFGVYDDLKRRFGQPAKSAVLAPEPSELEASPTASAGEVLN